jgi:small subunit ribosomal protein S24e
MDIEILEKKHEPLMKRTQFTAKVVFEGKTPSRMDVKKPLCQKLQSKEEQTVIRKITTDYGSERALFEGYFYEDDKAMDKLENRYVRMRHLSKTEQQAEKERIKAAKQAAKASAGSKKK